MHLCVPITYFGGMEPESAKMCIYMVTWITVVKPVVWVMSFIPAYGFRAAGDVKFTMIVSVVSMWVCRVTFVIILARVFGMGSYGSVDRYVYGLDREVHYLYGKVQKPQMAGAQGYLMVSCCCIIRKPMKKRFQC